MDGEGGQLGAPSTFSDANHQTHPETYFGDVAHCSATAGSVDANDTQYYQTIDSVTADITSGTNRRPLLLCGP